MANLRKQADMTERICSIDGCDNPHDARGFCGKHYQRWKKHGTTDDPTKNEICSMDGCSNKYYGRGWCKIHWKRWYNTGSPEGRAGRTPKRLITVCTIEGCEIVSQLTRGMCYKHYARWRRNGHLEVREKLTTEERILHRRANWQRWYEANEERLKPVYAANQARWAARNPDKVEAQRARKRNDRVRQNKLTREWIKRNPERMRLIRRNKQQRRRARKAGAVVGATQYRALIVQHGMVCHICGGSIFSLDDLHMDHVIPLVRGGSHTVENLRPAHAKCNLRKGAKLLN